MKMLGSGAETIQSHFFLMCFVPQRLCDRVPSTDAVPLRSQCIVFPVDNSASRFVASHFRTR